MPTSDTLDEVQGSMGPSGPPAPSLTPLLVNLLQGTHVFPGQSISLVEEFAMEAFIQRKVLSCFWFLSFL